MVSPVFFKELGQLAVSRKPLAMKAILLAILIADFLICLGTASRYDGMASGELGRTLFATLTMVELLAMTVFTPVVTAGMVCGEREANTLGLLFLTRLKAWNIVQDKGLSRIVLMLILCAITLPFMFAALLFGGVEPLHILAAAANILSVILFTGGISLLFSTRARRYGAALAMSYTAIFVGYVVLPIVIVATDGNSRAGGIFMAILLIGACVLFAVRARRAGARPAISYIVFVVGCLLVPVALTMVGASGRRPSSAEWLVALINPYASTMMIMDAYQMKTAGWLRFSWGGNLVVSLLLYVLAVVVASRLLRRIAFSEAAPAPVRERRITYRSMAGLVRPFRAASWFQRGRRIGVNPVAWKESDLLHDHLKTTLYGLADFLFGLYLLLMCLAGANNALDEAAMHAVGHAVAFTILAVFVAIMAACSFARERESGTLNVLLTTRLDGKSIVLGTFLGLLRSAAPLAIILVWVLLIGVVFTGGLLEQLVTPLVLRCLILGGGAWGTLAILRRSQLPWFMGRRGVFRSLLIAGLVMELLGLFPITDYSCPSVDYSLGYHKEHVRMDIPLLNIAVYFTFVIVVGMWRSLASKTTAAAIGSTLCILLLPTVVLPLLFVGLDEGLDLHGLGNLVMACSPDYWIAAGASCRQFDSDFGGMTGYVMATTAYVVLSWFLLRRMIRTFDRRVGRQTGGRTVGQ